MKLFKTNTDKEMKMINRYSLQDYYIRDNTNVKKYLSVPMHSTKCNELYKLLFENNIIPSYNNDKNGILFDLSNMVSLRTYLDSKGKNISLVIHEVQSFVSRFKKYMFIHGNLNLDNVFLSEIGDCVECRVIDFDETQCITINTDKEDIRNALIEYFKNDPVKLNVIISN